MPEVDTSIVESKDNVLRMWWSYHRRWVKRWAKASFHRSSKVVDHVLSALAGAFGALIGLKYGLISKHQFGLALLVAIVGYACLIFLTWIWQAIFVSSSMDNEQQERIKELETAFKEQEHIARAANAESLRQSVEIIDLEQRLRAARGELEPKKRELADLYAENERLRNPFTDQKRQHFLEKLAELSTPEKDVLHYLVSTGASGDHAGWEAATKSGYSSGDDLRGSIRRKTGFIRMANHGEEINPDLKPLLERWASTYQPGPVVADKAQLTLESLMETDFPSMMVLSGKPVVNFPDGSSFEIRSKLYIDFSSGGKFIGLCVPTSPKTFEICIQLAAHTKEIGDALHDGLRVISKPLGENPMEIKALAYTGRVYLYHDDFLTHRQIADIEDQFRAHQLNVTLRGPDHLTRAFLVSKQTSTGN